MEQMLIKAEDEAVTNDVNGGDLQVSGGVVTEGAGKTGTDDNTCRDYLRNVCRRGKRCKYSHPDEEEESGSGAAGGGGNNDDSVSGSRKGDLVFCHDFQNKECRRVNCKFIHCSRADEDYFHSNGELPPRVAEMLHHHSNNMPHHDESVPACKDYLKGDCRRGIHCKFRHIDHNMGPGGDFNRGGPPRYGGGGMGYGGGGSNYENFDYYEPPERKRRMFGDFGGGMAPGGRPAGGPPDLYILEEENAFLRRKVDELKKTVGDLTATNEFLLDQNAQLRLGKQGGGNNSGIDDQRSLSNNAAGSQAPLVSYPIMTQSMRPSMGSMGH